MEQRKEVPSQARGAKAVTAPGCGNFSSRSSPTEKHPRQRLCNHQKTFRAAQKPLKLNKVKKIKLWTRGAGRCRNRNMCTREEKLEKVEE